MPGLVRLYIRSVAIGFALAALFEGAMIWQDVAGLGHLILGSPKGWIAALMILAFFGTMFSGVQFAIRIMMMAGGEPPRGGLRQHRHIAPALSRPAPVPATADRRPRRA